jgi:hypothetical protein
MTSDVRQLLWVMTSFTGGYLQLFRTDSLREYLRFQQIWCHIIQVSIQYGHKIVMYL